jgi:hypothetical protein
LLAAPATPGALANFAEERWRAAAAQGDAGSLVARDLDRLRTRISSEDDEIWTRLLIVAVEYLAWSNAFEARAPAQTYRQEIERAEHLHRRLEYLIDRCDMALEIAAVWRNQQNDLDLSDELIALVRQSRLIEFPQVRPRLEACLAQALNAPATLLEMLTGVGRRSSVALSAFGDLMDRWCEVVQNAWHDCNNEEMKMLVRTFVRRSNFLDYDAWRPNVLHFCITESILAGQLAQLLRGIEIEGVPEVAERIRNDQPLQLVTLAALLFWA